jgi:hypothetical protein
MRMTLVYLTGCTVYYHNVYLAGIIFAAICTLHHNFGSIPLRAEQIDVPDAKVSEGFITEV